MTTQASNAQQLVASRQGKAQDADLPTENMRKMLIVEDEALVALQISSIMENLGWSIVGPAMSLAKAGELVSGEKKLDAAILDVNLGGASVFALADRLHSRGVPILFHTAHSDLVEADRYAGCSKLSKPSRLPDMVAQIKALTEISERQVRNAGAAP